MRKRPLTPKMKAVISAIRNGANVREQGFIRVIYPVGYTGPMLGQVSTQTIDAMRERGLIFLIRGTSCYAVTEDLGK